MPRFGKKRNNHYYDNSDDSDDLDYSHNKNKNQHYCENEHFTISYGSNYNYQNISNTFKKDDIPIIPSGGLEYINSSIWDLECDMQNQSKIKDNILIIKKNLSILQLQIKPNQELIDKTLDLIIKSYYLI